MGLKEKRQRFYAIRGHCKILVKFHAYKDHPKRLFTELEIKNLVKFGIGRVEENKSSQAIPDSFLFYPKDEEGRECKLVVLLTEVEIENISGDGKKEMILICSAFREV